MYGIVATVPVGAVQAGDDALMLDLSILRLLLGDLQIFEERLKARPDVVPANWSAQRKRGKCSCQSAMKVHRPAASGRHGELPPDLAGPNKLR